ncbi:HNH endonuclease [Streptomyces sp. NPDC058371]|uniref:HNH endonuclease n=1 Tax=Streptomyces sp. NPDC058371 TaxID=3346463 RepID=UPI00364AB9C7
MPEGRPAIPRPLERRVLVEAGHRCAIPTCRTVPVELAHIDPWSKVQEHTFENLIALCPTCHTRYDNGDIDRLSMKTYKANLSVISGRYGEMERRILDLLVESPQAAQIRLPGGWDIQLMYLIKDGLLAVAQGGARIEIAGIPAHQDFVVTPAGRDFVSRWVKAEPVEGDD